METPARHSFTLDGTTQVFPIPSNLKGDNYVRVEVDGTVVNDKAKYDIVNNSIVMNFVEDVPDGSQLDVLVVQSEEAIGQLGTTSSVDIVAVNISIINDVNDALEDIITAADNIVDIQNAEENAASALASKNAAATSATNANNSATAAATSASNAASSATSASTSATTATTQATAAGTSATNASNSASAASTSASQAVSSASNASTSASQAATSATSAATSATNASNSASSASTSATTATTQAGIATTQAGIATTQASNAASSASSASTSATNASTSADNASTSATEASTSASNAAASYDSFDDRYLGAKFSEPSMDNDGNTLLIGALYFNTVNNTMKIWDGTGWLNAYASFQEIDISTSTPAVRITQRGTGDALLVEDASNPDSTPFVIDANGNVGIGTSSPTEKLEVAGNIKVQNNGVVVSDANLTLSSDPTNTGAASAINMVVDGLEVADFNNAGYLRFNKDNFGGAGICTQSLDSSLSIAGGNTAINSGLNIRLSAPDHVSASAGLLIRDGVTNVYQYLRSSLAHIWSTSGVERMRIDSTGNVAFSNGIRENVFAVSGTTPALSPANGTIQTWTLSGDSTPTAGTWNAGESITLMVDDGSAYTITWATLAVEWKTDGGVAPTLNTSGYTAIVLWKVGSTTYGARVGDA